MLIEPNWGLCLIWLTSSFTNEPTSIGLNVSIEAAPGKSDCQDGAAADLQNSSSAFGIPEAVVTSHMRLGLLKSLKFSQGSYTASVSPTLDSN